MANTFTLGETVVCSITVKDAGTLADPATSMNILVDQIENTSRAKVTVVAMSKDSTGTYHYDCQTSGWEEGTYRITYVATDGARITRHTDSFNLTMG